MTAINPAQLTIHCAELSSHFTDPDQFVRELHDLLQKYADHIHRSGRTSTVSKLPSYQVPTPVLRTVEREIKRFMTISPSQGLLLVDALWEEEYLETRMLAAAFLGQIPPLNPASILDRLKAWTSSPASDTIRCEVITAGLAKINQQMPEASAVFLEGLLIKPTQRSHQAVLCGLNALAGCEAFQDLPFAYYLLSQILEDKESGLVTEISRVLQTLIQRSEQETMYFLSRQLTSAAQPRITRVVRTVLPSFSPSNQHLLKTALRT